MEFINDYLSTNITPYLKDLQQIVQDSKEELEGNCFYIHRTLIPFPELITKQANLFWCGKQVKTRICEIGFNAGHSALLLLAGVPKTQNVQFTIFDINEHKYTTPCFNYLKTKFQNINFDFICGDSTIELPKFLTANDVKYTFDVVHVDGGHTEYCIRNDLANADKLVRNEGYIIVDDTQDVTINKYVDDLLSTENYHEVYLCKTAGYKHRILQKVPTEDYKS